ncbi:outer membrane receptor for ferrienterochelin and colicins [Celeribacter indicus]|uniref:Outer membrane receptor for ferrienterochelin and colicins n=2 Tax=Celeribacter indicus TaxID=1208324 RepID=A0A0B5E914_9RHOB|nr:outer membrane receptor for ferrienterochelin and colicins [Celeribacter indicus]
MRPLGRALYLASGASLLALSPSLLMAQSSGGSAVTLDPIVVDGDADTADTEISSETLQTRYSGNAQNALNAIPGVSTRQSSSQPGIEVNIRGMSGYGRVNAMIDGVPQSFKNTAGHEASGGSLLYVHPEFLSALEVQRGVVAGAAGSGTLTGSADFRTLTLDDVLLRGRTEGGMARLKFGDNGYNYSGLLSYGKRFGGLWGGDGHVDVLMGYAYTDEDDYATGDGGELSSDRSSVNTPEGKLAKIEIAPNAAHKLSFGARWYENTFENSSYTWDVDNRTWTADYEYAPGSDLVNLKLSAYYNETTLFYPGTGGSYAGRETEEETTGISLTNRSRFGLAGGADLVLDYGLSWTRDDFQTHAMRGGNHPGKLDKASLFAEGEIDYGRTVLFGGLRYDHWRVDGYRPPYPSGVADCPAGGPSCGDEWVTRDGGELLPNLGISHDLTPDFTVSASYAQTFRPPSTHEMFYSLVPFGDGVGSGMTNNLSLDPERSRTFELSGEYRQTGLLSAGDEGWFKLSAFRSRIENYIVNDFVEIPGDPSSRAMWINTDGTTTMEGLEFEGGYDSGRVYVNLSFSISDTDDQPVANGTGMGNGLTSAQPDRMATLDLGLRALDERLTLGSQIRHTGSTVQAAFDWTSYPDGAYLEKTRSYTLVDLYGSYAVSEGAELFFSVENVFDKSYGYPGGSAAGYQEMAGRGRTFIAGLTTRF